MWMDLPVWVRLLVAFCLFGLGAIIWYYMSVRLGFAVFALGFVALVFSSKSTSEKKGYRF